MRQGVQLFDEAPDFELPATNGDTVRLSSFRGQARVVLVFLRGFR